MRTIWYMGAKTRLTADIAAAVEAAAPRSRRGPQSVLDLMSGTGVVGRALAPRYRVVANDVQAYAQTIASAYLEHPDLDALAGALDPERDLGAAFRANQAKLLEWLGPAVALEDAFLTAFGLLPETPDPEAGPFLPGPTDLSPPARRRPPGDAAARARAYREFALRETPAYCEASEPAASGPFRAAQPLFRRAAVRERRQDPRAFPYLLASSYYPNVYLGLRQAVAVDSLRYAIDRLQGPLARGKRTHYLAALLHACSVTTSATSHFCQPRGLVRDAEVRAVLQRRAQSIPSKLLAFSRAILAGARAARPRPGNLALQGDWRGAFARWDEVAADVVYVDPPYTADNYSRFYHVLEVLTRYDYPELEVRRGKTTKGRYPALHRRHRSPFCGKRTVEGELRAVIAACAERGAGLVLSYGEENGLLLRTYRDAGDRPARALARFADLAREAYHEVELRKRRLLHSGQGDSNQQVTELLLIGRRPRAPRGRRRGSARCG